MATDWQLLLVRFIGPRSSPPCVRVVDFYIYIRICILSHGHIERQIPKNVGHSNSQCFFFEDPDSFRDL